MPRKPQPPSKPPRFFPAGEDHDLLDDVDDDAPTPIIEFGCKKPCRSKRPMPTENKAEKRCPRKCRR